MNTRPHTAIGTLPRQRWPAGLILLLLLLAFGLIFPRTEDIRTVRRLAQTVEELAPPPIAVEDAGQVFHYVGVGRCSASGCHGGVRQTPSGPLGGREYLVWIAKDPHSKAFSTLFSVASQRMVLAMDTPLAMFLTTERQKQVSRAAPAEPGARTHAFEIPPGSDVEREYYAALERQKCIDCHGTRGPAEKISKQVLWSDGVSCESCHGPAAEWLGTHAAPVANRTGLTANQKAGFAGMQDLEDVSVRAQTCVKCHVGSPAAEVNHDLLAAGHPQLQFEFADYMRRMHRFRHWEPAQDLAWRQEDYAARNWAVGQAEATRAALELRRHRLSPQGSAWPEFSEFDCQSCHHALRDEAWRQQRASREGVFLPGSWYYSIYAEHSAATGLLADDPAALRNVSSNLRSMQEKLQRLGLAGDDRQQLLNTCTTTAAHLAQLSAELNRHEYSPQACQQAIGALSAGEPGNWSAAAQRYNGMAALYPSSPDSETLRDELLLLYEALTQKEAHQVRFDRREVGNRLQAIHSLIEQ